MWFAPFLQHEEHFMCEIITSKAASPTSQEVRMKKQAKVVARSQMQQLSLGVDTYMNTYRASILVAFQCSHIIQLVLCAVPETIVKGYNILLCKCCNKLQVTVLCKNILLQVHVYANW